MSTDAVSPEWRYSLRPGDTLIGVLARYPADWPKLQRFNRTTHPRHLTPGSTLRIPLAWLRHEPAPATAAAASGRMRVSLHDAAERALLADEQCASGAALPIAANGSASPMAR